MGRLENMLVAAEVYGEINKNKFETMSPFNKIIYDIIIIMLYAI